MPDYRRFDPHHKSQRLAASTESNIRNVRSNEAGQGPFISITIYYWFWKTLILSLAIPSPYFGQIEQF